MSAVSRLTPVLPVRDVLSERAFYEHLGFMLYIDPAETYPETAFAALSAGEHVLFGLAAVADFDTQTAEGRLWWQFETYDLDVNYASASAAGLQVVQLPQIESWGRRTMKLRSPNGYLVTFEERTR